MSYSLAAGMFLVFDSCSSPTLLSGMTIIVILFGIIAERDLQYYTILLLNDIFAIKIRSPWRKIRV